MDLWLVCFIRMFMNGNHVLIKKLLFIKHAVAAITKEINGGRLTMFKMNVIIKRRLLFEN